MNKLFTAPSFYAHAINGFLLFVSFVLLYINYSKLIKIDNYKLIILVLFLSISVGVHGISHLGLEKEYDLFLLSNKMA